MSKKNKNPQEEMDKIFFEDPETYVMSTNEKIDFRFILMRQIDKVRTARSTEMRGGYNEKRYSAVNGMTNEYEIYVPDTRQTYINSVKTFKMLMITYWDEEFKDEFDKLLIKLGEEKEESKDDLLESLVDVMDLVVEQLLLLCTRVGLIGSNMSIRDEVRK